MTGPEAIARALQLLKEAEGQPYEVAHAKTEAAGVYASIANTRAVIDVARAGTELTLAAKQEVLKRWT